MAAKLAQLRAQAARAAEFASKHGGAYYKEVMEKNKQYVVQPPTVEKCQELSKQLFYTRLASLPGRYEAFWKELDSVKQVWKNRKDLKVEDLGAGARTRVHGTRWPRVALLPHRPTGTAPRPHSSRQEPMATIAPRSHLLLLGLTRPQQPTALRACAAFSRSRGAPVPPRAAQPRRVFLGLGATFIDQVTRMASGGTSSRSFVAGARPRQGVSPVEQILKNVEWPDEFPFKPEDFSRFDESSDTLFYSVPRFVTHIDDQAIRALTEYYSEVLPPSNTPGATILDMCSSWVSHYPPGYKQEKIVGMGMNEDELKKNSVLTEYVVQDLNVNPKLPFEDNTFDVITNVVSVDYLTKPIDVFKEMRRILKPSGLAIMSFSNRCFWTKAISIWTSTGDVDHAWIVGAYFHYAGGFEPPQAVDISPNPGRTDPMYVVCSRKKIG